MSTPAQPNTPDNKPSFITKKELLKRIPYCDQHILRLEKAGKFPRRLDLGTNRVVWIEREIDEWMMSRPRRRYLAQDDIGLT